MRFMTPLTFALLFPSILVSLALAQPKRPEPAPSKVSADKSKLNPQEGGKDEVTSLRQNIAGQQLRDDLEQFRSLLKQEWILSNLNDADFDAAITSIARDADVGMTVAELTLRLQRVLAMSSDGHAAMGQFPGAMQTIEGVRPDFLIDISGEGYTAYRVEQAAGDPINPKRKHRFVPLKEGYPHLLAIDGLPVSDWVQAAEPYISRRPRLAMRWRAMRILQELPFLRRELHLPNPATIRLRLASTDRKSEIELDAPTNRYQRWHLKVPRPDSSILDGNIGYLWISNAASGGVEAIVKAMPKLRVTRGLIVDLRDNTGGTGLDTLQVMAAYLLPLDQPRLAVGQIVQWQGDRQATNTAEVAIDAVGLSAESRRIITSFQDVVKRGWRPPQGRSTESRVVFLARSEAEPDLFPYNHELFPKTYSYTAPVVVLFNHRCFSAAELFLAGIRELPGVTLVGSTTTAGGGGSPEFFRLQHSGLDVILSQSVFVRADGTLIDGHGIAPDVVVEGDWRDYLDGQDRMLEKAIEVLEGNILGRK
jgi:hypothetical protein